MKVKVIKVKAGQAKLREAIKDALKAAMGDSESIQAGEYKITWKAVTSSRIDTTALKKAMPDVAERFTKETTTRRFCVAEDVKPHITDSDF